MDVVRVDGGEREDEIIDLARRALGWDDDPRNRSLYRWKHDENPFGRSPRWVAVEDGRVVGFRIFMRWRFRRGDEVVTAVRAVDTATDPDHQGKGIFRALTLRAVDEMTDEGVGFVFNTPNDKSRPGYLKMGWVELGRPPVAMAPRPSSFVRVARARAAADKWSEPTDAGRPATEGLADRRLPRPPVGAWATDHDEASLRWRYSHEPLRYRLVEADGGWAVVRARRRGAALEATVGDLVATDARSRRRVLRQVLRTTGADYALVRSTGRIDPTPAVSMPAFGPLVTWRALTVTTPPDLSELALTVGDLELF